MLYFPFRKFVFETFHHCRSIGSWVQENDTKNSDIIKKGKSTVIGFCFENLENFKNSFYLQEQKVDTKKNIPSL